MDGKKGNIKLIFLIKNFSLYDPTHFIPVEQKDNYALTK